MHTILHKSFANKFFLNMKTNENQLYHTVLLALGSNLGDKKANLKQAVELIQTSFILEQDSSIYRTKPRDYLSQPYFFNQVVKVKTALSDPLKVLQITEKIEKKMGKEIIIPKGPRVIDIDILLFDDWTYQKNGLIIPHRELENRNFFISPLMEILSEYYIIPGTNKTLKQCYQKVKNQQIERTD